MTQAVPDCMVTNFEGLIRRFLVLLHDVDDRHACSPPPPSGLVRRRS